MPEDIYSFNPFVALRKYTGILKNTEKMREQKVEDYVEALIQEVAREHPEYLREGANVGEMARGISSKLTEKIMKDGAGLIPQ